MCQNHLGRASLALSTADGPHHFLRTSFVIVLKLFIRLALRPMLRRRPDPSQTSTLFNSGVRLP